MQSIAVFFALFDPSVLELIQGVACKTLGFKISHPITGMHRPLQLQDIEAHRISRKPTCEDGKVVIPTHWPS